MSSRMLSGSAPGTLTASPNITYMRAFTKAFLVLSDRAPSLESATRYLKKRESLEDFISLSARSWTPRSALALASPTFCHPSSTLAGSMEERS